MKENKGITLVALIITIIVMVILAGIIIVSAVADGGVIDRAQEALKAQEEADIEEIIIGSYVYKVTASTTSVAGKLDMPKTAIAIYKNLDANNFTVLDSTTINGEPAVPISEDGTNINVVVKGKHGTYNGNVTESGVVEIEPDSKQGLNPEPPIGDKTFQIAVSKEYDEEYNEMMLIIRPVFDISEDDAYNELKKQIGIPEGVENEKVVIHFCEAIFDEKFSTLDDIKLYVKNEFEEEINDEADAWKLICKLMGASGDTVEDVALYMVKMSGESIPVYLNEVEYEGEYIVEEDDEYIAIYDVKNGDYIVTLEMFEKKATSTINIFENKNEYSVTVEGKYVTYNKYFDSSILEGENFEITFSPNNKYKIPDEIKVTMGDKDLIKGEDYFLENGKLTVNNVIGNLVIKVEAIPTVQISSQLQVGDYVKYDTGISTVGDNGVINCRVLYDNNSEYGLQLVSIEGLEEISFSGMDGFNNCITDLNNAALTYKNLDYAEDTRCVGSNPSNKNAGANVVCTIPTAPNEYIDYSDDNNTYDLQAMKKIGISDDNFWTASRYCRVWGTSGSEPKNVLYCVRGGTLNSTANYALEVCDVDILNKKHEDTEQKRDLRICVKLKTDLKVISGDGTYTTNAYVLAK